MAVGHPGLDSTNTIMTCTVEVYQKSRMSRSGSASVCSSITTAAVEVTKPCGGSRTVGREQQRHHQLTSCVWWAFNRTYMLLCRVKRIGAGRIAAAAAESPSAGVQSWAPPLWVSDGRTLSRAGFISRAQEAASNYQTRNILLSSREAAQPPLCAHHHEEVGKPHDVLLTVIAYPLLREVYWRRKRAYGCCFSSSTTKRGQ